MRILEKLLFLIGMVCLGLYGFFTVQAWWYQAGLEESFDQMRLQPEPTGTVVPLEVHEGDTVGRLEIPRLNLSVMVMEGIGSQTLRLGAGHIPGTARPGEHGNAGIAAHRDTFFRKLADIREGDQIRFQTLGGTTAYRVSSTLIVKPAETNVLLPAADDLLTLVTCYPFSYVGPAPKRFIVHATRE